MKKAKKESCLCKIVKKALNIINSIQLENEKQNERTQTFQIEE